MHTKNLGHAVYDAAGGAPPVEPAASTGAELLVGLWVLLTPDRDAEESWLPRDLGACSPGLRRAAAGIGERAGELWLHLIGLAFEGPEPATAAGLTAALRGLDASELRRHLVGVYVPSWQAVAGLDLLEGAARGDRPASSALLANRRYYAGRAREALTQLLPLSARETKRRVVAVVERFAEEVLAPHEADVARALEHDAAAKRALAERLDPLALIAAATGGFDYDPEDGTARVVLVPHVAGRPWLLLCQHRDARLICYPAAAPAESEQALRERALRLGRGLGDAARVEMLRRLAAGEATLNDLVAATGLSRSTAHHHLAQLRAAGLVTMRGNARSYSYALRREGLEDAGALLAALVAPPPDV